ncbi:response regulator [Brenneria uluponensis]|uniref:response regulator n=1 Tax=Brenneria uluponensis TaxID=3057057 RepID=UPI0028E41B23|nr:response regulator [Brenneria ulupoensis]
MKSINIMIVEDEAELAEIFSDFIKENARFCVSGIASSLSEAKKMLRIYKPNLILLDNFLPDGQGLELIKYLITEKSHARVIFITSDNDMKTISEAIRLGVFDYLIKPIHHQRLQQTLERYKRYLGALRSQDQANQQHVDALFKIQSKEMMESGDMLPKGLDICTLQKVRELFERRDQEHTTETLAKILGSSRTTARRYLEYGVKENLLEAEIIYGRVGRPERIYRTKRHI